MLLSHFPDFSWGRRPKRRFPLARFLSEAAGSASESPSGLDASSSAGVSYNEMSIGMDYSAPPTHLGGGSEDGEVGAECGEEGVLST